MKPLHEWDMTDILLAGVALAAVFAVANLVMVLSDLVGNQVLDYAHAAHTIAREMHDRLPPSGAAPKGVSE